MAEFSEVMRQWKRMCNYYTERAGNEHDVCAICKFEGDGSNCLAVYEDSEIDTAEVERVVMAWADEHPEPVYPTWKEWLEEQRVVVHFDSISEKGTKVKWELTNKSNCRIPADIAEKLGIQPK